MSLVDTQTSIEYFYNKRRIGEMIEKDIQDTPEILDKVENCINALSTHYLMGPHFKMKNEYLSSITKADLSKLVYRVMQVSMPLPKGLTFSSLVGQSEGCIKQANKLNSFKIVSSVIYYMIEFKLLKLIRAGDANSRMMEIIPVYICDAKITNFIKQSLYLPPMVCAPRKLTHNKSSAYLTVKNESLILKSYNHHEGNICLDSLNKFNNVALSLDIQMLTTFDEQPKKIIDTNEKQKQFDKLREDSYRVYKLLIQSGNNFHLTHKVDKRGRTYAQGYHCSTQGNSFRKAIVNLAKKEIVNGSFT